MATRTATERLLLRLEWQVLRRLDGRIAGGYRTAHRGGGIDLAGLRDYVEGDDARHIDWNVTARLNEPQLRVFNEDRELTVWLVLDRSASMTVGAPGRGKHEVLSELAFDVLRHRIVLSYEALADDITPDAIITRVLDAVAAPEIVLSGR